MLYVFNDNDIKLTNMRYWVNNSAISNASFVLTILTHNTLVISSVSKAANAVITFTTNHEFEVGQEVTVLRVVNSTSVNGKFTIASVTDTTITLTDADTTSDEDYILGSGSVYQITDPTNAKEVAFTYVAENTYYVATISHAVPLIPKKKYITLIEEPSLFIVREKLETAGIRS